MLWEHFSIVIMNKQFSLSAETAANSKAAFLMRGTGEEKWQTT